MLPDDSSGSFHAGLSLHVPSPRGRGGRQMAVPGAPPLCSPGHRYQGRFGAGISLTGLHTTSCLHRPCSLHRVCESVGRLGCPEAPGLLTAVPEQSPRTLFPPTEPPDRGLAQATELTIPLSALCPASCLAPRAVRARLAHTNAADGFQRLGSSRRSSPGRGALVYWHGRHRPPDRSLSTRRAQKALVEAWPVFQDG